ncbi:hypothetical protein PWT90_02193 [Aphanocladium album]|nr:hypothetical protein PWT90_02193 [Aphanocladium album]
MAWLRRWRKSLLSSLWQERYTLDQFHAAVREDNVPHALRTLCGHRTSVSPDGNTALGLAAICGSPDMLNMLLKASRDDLDHANSQNETPLFLAARHGKVHAVELLLHEGADGHRSLGPLQMTPLSAACRNGHADVVRRIIAHGAAEVHVQDVHGATALHWAATWSARGGTHPAQCKAIFRLLLDAGATIDARDSEDCTPLQYAEWYQSAECTAALVRLGAGCESAVRAQASGQCLSDPHAQRPVF